MPASYGTSRGLKLPKKATVTISVINSAIWNEENVFILFVWHFFSLYPAHESGITTLSIAKDNENNTWYELLIAFTVNDESFERFVDFIDWFFCWFDQGDWLISSILFNIYIYYSKTKSWRALAQFPLSSYTALILFKTF